MASITVNMSSVAAVAPAATANVSARRSMTGRPILAAGLNTKASLNTSAASRVGQKACDPLGAPAARCTFAVDPYCFAQGHPPPGALTRAWRVQASRMVVQAKADTKSDDVSYSAKGLEFEEISDLIRCATRENFP